MDSASILFVCLAIALAACSNLTPRDQKNFKVEPDDYAMIAHEALQAARAHARHQRDRRARNDMNPDARRGD